MKKNLNDRVQVSNTAAAFAVNPSSPAGRVVSAMTGGQIKGLIRGFVIGPVLGLALGKHLKEEKESFIYIYVTVEDRQGPSAES